MNTSLSDRPGFRVNRTSGWIDTCLVYAELTSCDIAELICIDDMKAVQRVDIQLMLQFVGVDQEPTIEFVKVAGTATHIHQSTPPKNSLPLPLTRALTNLPSSSATYKLINVLTTRKTVCMTNNLASLLLTPGITILSSRHKLRKNSRFSSTLGFFVCACRGCWCLSGSAPDWADFCSEIAFRTRLMSARKSVR